jgi:hypothetical protein
MKAVKYAKLSRLFLSGVFLTSSILISSQSFAVGGPNPSEVYISSISYGGSGCPQGTVGQSLSSDRTSMTLIFDEFIASVGPGVAITESRKNCQLNINLRIPQGWSYTIGTMDYRGFANLARGHVGTQKSIYYFQGEIAQVSKDTVFRGPMSKDYLIRDTIPMNSVVWSECNKVVPLNINTQVRIDNSGNRATPGQLTTDSIDGKVKKIFGLQWKRC